MLPYPCPTQPFFNLANPAMYIISAEYTPHDGADFGGQSGGGEITENIHDVR